MSESLLERARRRAAEMGVAPAAEAQVSVEVEPAAPARVWDPELIPDVEPYERSEQDREIDAVIDSVDILEAYRKWCGKMEPKVGSRAESIMISCPIPGHADKNPSAWINSEKGVWHCGACGQGGDKFDIAAFHYGYAVPGYKTDGSFPELRRDMAEGCGYVVRRTLGGQTYLERVVTEPEPEPDPDGGGGSPYGERVPQTEPEPDSHPGNLIVLPSVDPDHVALTPTINWKKILPNDGFLRQWMLTTSEDDLPEEYYLWLGFMAVGFAIGNDAVLADNPPVHGNLFLCLYGPSGIGKTRATGVLRQLLRKALPYDHADEHSRGVYLAPVAGSAESLIDCFSKPIYDPTQPGVVTGYASVRGLVRVDELSSLIGRANRSGSTLKPTLMEFYDGYETIELRSRGHGHTKAENPFCSAVTSTQPGAVRQLLLQHDADSGFVNRWVFAAGRPKELVSYGRDAMSLDHLVPLLQGLRTWAGTRRREVRLEGEAFEVWDEFFHTRIEPIRKSDDTSLLTRTDLTLKKVILLLAADEQTELPDADLVGRAISLYEYLSQTYGSLGQNIGIGLFEDCRNAIGEKLRELEQKLGRAVSVRDLNRAINKRYPRDLVARVLQTMMHLGEVDEEVVDNQRGPKSKRYHYAG